MFRCVSCWDAPSLAPSLVFSLFHVLLSHLWELKKEREKEGWRDIKGNKGIIEQERRIERKKVLKEKCNKKIINYLKKFFKASCRLQTGQASFAGLFGYSRLRGTSPALLLSRPALGQPPSQLSSSHSPAGTGTYPPGGYGVHAGPSAVCTLPGALDVCPRGPPRWAFSPVPQMWAQCPPHPHRSARWLGREEARAVAAGEFPKLPPSVFFLTFSFWEIPPAHSCRSIQGRTCPLTQPTSPTRLGTVLVRAPHVTTLNSPQLVHRVSMGLPLHPYSPPATSTNQVSQCYSNLVWQGREPLTRLSLRSPASGPAGAGPGATVTLVLALVPVTLLAWSNPRTVCFFSVFYTFWSPIFINVGVLLAVHSMLQ